MQTLYINININISLFVEDKRKMSVIKLFSLKCYSYNFILKEYRVVLPQIYSE